eukprot:2158969-Prymnesium_polylepis.1
MPRGSCGFALSRDIRQARSSEACARGVMYGYVPLLALATCSGLQNGRERDDRRGRTVTPLDGPSAKLSFAPKMRHGAASVAGGD